MSDTGREKVILHRMPNAAGTYWVGDSSIMAIRMADKPFWRLQAVEEDARSWLRRTGGLDKVSFERLRDLRQAMEAEVALLGPPPKCSSNVDLTMRWMSAGRYQTTHRDGSEIWICRMPNGKWSVTMLTAEGRVVELTTVFQSLWYAKRAVGQWRTILPR